MAITKTQIVMIIGPNNPKRVPPYRKSFCSSLPVLYAIALGGVDIGKYKAAEALKPITKGKIAGFSKVRIRLIGIRIVAVAVLLMIFDKITVRKAKLITIA